MSGIKVDRKVSATRAKPKSEKEFATGPDKTKNGYVRMQRVNFDLDDVYYQHLRREAFERNVSQAEILREMIVKRYRG
jgi:hypothetical protein